MSSTTTGGPDPFSKQKPGSSVHADRFRVVLAALIGLAIGALAIAAAVLIAHDNSSGSPGSSQSGSSFQWSTFKPTGSGNEAATEIADYVAPSYRLTFSEQLAIITPIAMKQLSTTTGAFTGSGLTLALDESGTGDAADYKALSGETVGYDLCGQGGPDCRVPAKSASDLNLLLRREAFELALYTFEYLPKAQNVAVVLPAAPPTGDATAKPVTTTVLFLRDELTHLLNEPLSATLATDPPEVSQLKAWRKTLEAGIVDEETGQALFSSKVEAEQDEGNLLVLTPLSAQ